MLAELAWDPRLGEGNLLSRVAKLRQLTEGSEQWDEQTAVNSKDWFSQIDLFRLLG